MIVFTYGDEGIPWNKLSFLSFFFGRDLLRGLFSDLKFADFGLGDRALIKLNATARGLNTRFAELGGHPVISIGPVDECVDHGHDDELISLQEQSVKLVRFDRFMESQRTSVGTGKRAPQINVSINSRRMESEMYANPGSNTDL